MNIKALFQYKPTSDYKFTLTSANPSQNENPKQDTDVYSSIDLNLNYIKDKYTTSINSDIMIRNFLLTARNTRI